MPFLIMKRAQNPQAYAQYVIFQGIREYILACYTFYLRIYVEYSNQLLRNKLATTQLVSQKVHLFCLYMLAHNMTCTKQVVYRLVNPSRTKGLGVTQNTKGGSTRPRHKNSYICLFSSFVLFFSVFYNAREQKGCKNQDPILNIFV